MEFVHGNTFTRTVANELKKGAYYTDVRMSKRIGKLLSFPQGEEVTVLEPSVGNAAAVRAVLESKGDCSTPLFAVELDRLAAQELKENLKADEYLLNADFIRGVNITPGSIGYCFANPPYDTDDFAKERYEEIFLRKIYTYLKKGGVLTYVIPYYLFTEHESFVMTMMNRFELVSIYRFDDDVYKQFKQVCVILRRRDKMTYSFGKKAYAEFLESFPKAEELPYLPEEPEECQKVYVPIAKKEDVKLFSTVIFDKEQAGRMLCGDSLDDLVGQKLFAPKYTANILKNPPLPPKKDVLYLCAISGAGQGLCGSEEKGDLHLQRGVVKTQVEQMIEAKASGEGKVLTEISRASIVMTIIENDGTIRQLE